MMWRNTGLILSLYHCNLEGSKNQTNHYKIYEEKPRTPQNTHHYILRRLADTDLYELGKKIAPLAEKIGFLPGNYTKFEKQVYYSQPSKKPPDNAGTP